MKEYEVYGTIEIPVEINIQANNEEDAIRQAKSELEDYYRVHVNGAYHEPGEVKLTYDAIEIED